MDEDLSVGIVNIQNALEGDSLPYLSGCRAYDVSLAAVCIVFFLPNLLSLIALFGLLFSTWFAVVYGSYVGQTFRKRGDFLR